MNNKPEAKSPLKQAAGNEQYARSEADVVTMLDPTIPCDRQLHIFHRRLREGALDEAAAALAAALSQALSYRLEPANPMPLRPWNADHFPIPADLPSETIGLLLEHLSDYPAEIRARVQDLAWEGARDRDPEHARGAFADYLVAADDLESPGADGAARDRLDRAFSLARMMRDDDRWDQVANIARTRAKDPEESVRLRVWLSALCFRRGVDGVENMPPVLEALAAKARPAAGTPGDWEWVRTILATVADGYAAAGELELERQVRKKRAATFQEHADWLLDSAHGPSMRATLLRRGVAAYRKIGDCREECEALDRQLAKERPRVVDALKTTHLGPSVELTEERRIAREAVAGLQWVEAVTRLALRVPPPEISKLEADAKAQMEAHPIGFLFSVSVLDQDGKQVARAAGGAIDHHILQMRNLGRGIAVYGAIEPAREQILVEHCPGTTEWLELLMPSAVFREETAEIWVKGLDAGLRGDFVVAVHLLLPMLEELARRALEASGVPIVSIDDQAVEKGTMLGSLLAHPELKRIWSEDLVEDLRSLLIDQAGPNIRNLVAHGATTSRALRGPAAQYVWYLALRLVVLLSPPAAEPDTNEA